MGQGFQGNFAKAGGTHNSDLTGEGRRVRRAAIMLLLLLLSMTVTYLVYNGVQIGNMNNRELDQKVQFKHRMSIQIIRTS